MKTSNGAPKSVRWTLRSILEDAARVMGYLVPKIVLTGFVGLLVGACATILFRRYLPILSLYFYSILAVVYFWIGGVLVWGYLGFLDGMVKTLRFLFFDRKALSFVTARLSSMVMAYMQKRFPEKFGLEQGETDLEKTAVTYEMMEKVLKHFKPTDTANSMLEEDGSTARRGNVISRFLRWLVMRTLVAKLLVMVDRRFHEKGGALTFAETRQLIVDLGDTVGEEILEELSEGKTIMLYGIVPLHLFLPVLITFIVLRVRH